MFEPDVYTVQERVTLLPGDRKKCAFIADVIVVQCIVVFVGSASILYCIWSPEKTMMDYDKLTRIMYLFDSDACGYKLHTTSLIRNLYINNETYGLDILPIKWQPAIVTVSTRLSAKTRKYVEVSVTIHAIWFVLAIAFRIIAKNSTDIRTLKVTLAIFFYSCVFVVCFDISMGVVYITHIKQSLTKGMILRYSGWSTELKLQSYDDFGGWLPIAASICWMRGFFICIINLYFCRVLTILRRKVRKREFRKQYPNEHYLPIPEPKQTEKIDKDVLVYRIGENMPQTKDKRGVFF